MKCCLALGKKKASRLLTVFFLVDGHFTEKKEKNGKKNYRGIVNRYSRIRDRQETYRKKNRIFE